MQNKLLFMILKVILPIRKLLNCNDLFLPRTAVRLSRLHGRPGTGMRGFSSTSTNRRYEASCRIVEMPPEAPWFRPSATSASHRSRAISY